MRHEDDTPRGDAGSRDIPVRLEAPFAMVPEALIYDPAISAAAVRVYAVLVRHGSDPSACYPSHPRIADLIGASPRSVPAWLRELEDAGWIQKFDRHDEAGRQTSNGYLVRAVQRATPAGERTPSPSATRGGPALSRAPKDSHVNESQTNERTDQGALALVGASAPAFDAFWQVYPRHVGKRTAAAAYERACRRVADPAVIFAGAVRYRDDPNRESEFTAHPATWLNRDGWEDDPLPAKGGRERHTAGGEGIRRLAEHARPRPDPLGQITRRPPPALEQGDHRHA